MNRVCACPCNRPLDGKRKSAKYYSAACRKRAWKEARGITGLRYVKASRNGKHSSGRQLTARKGEQAVIDALWLIAKERAEGKPPRPAEEIAHEATHG